MDRFCSLGPETERTIAGHLYVKHLIYKTEKEEIPMR